MATTAVQAVEKNITSVALADIQPSNYNPRKNFDETSLAELAESIRQQGVLQPIGVRPIADNRFEIVFGERRYRASLMAELAEIPATVMEISDETAEEMAMPCRKQTAAGSRLWKQTSRTARTEPPEQWRF